MRGEQKLNNARNPFLLPARHPMEELLLAFSIPSPEELIRYGGLALICAVIFIETGLLLGLVIPGGDSFLFTAGLLCATQVLPTSIFLLIPLLIVSGILGDLLGYTIGKKLGRKLFSRPDSWIFKRKHLQQAQDFYQRKGKTAIIAGKFLSVVRTFNPLLSGATRMPLGTYLTVTSIGTALWISALVLTGYFAGHQFPWLKDYIPYLIPGIILVSVLPLILKYLRKRPSST
jgi:membrane-associated protein